VLALAMPQQVRSIDEQSPVPPDGVDVSALIESLSVEELAKTADEYFASQIDGVDFWHAKPFWHNSEVVDMVITFAHVLDALRLSPGMRVLDFGAGTGWTSRYLSQLDCSVIVRGHEKVLAGGQLRSPLVATRSPRWWPAEVPAPR